MSSPEPHPEREHPAIAAHRTRRRESAALLLADMITDFSGSMRFVALHVLWFGIWIVLNLTVLRFDPFPFGLLTMLVSLEAIFLSTFVLISQNRHEQREHLVVDHHYRETALLEALLRQNTRLTEEIHRITTQAAPSGQR